MKNLYHPSQLWEGKIDYGLTEIEKITPRDIYDPILFKNMVFEHMTKALCKDIDAILDSLLCLAKIGIKFRESFYIIRAIEKLSVDWKYQISFLKITEILIFIMMVYVVSPQDTMNIAVTLGKNFKIDSESFDEEIHGLKLFLPVTHLAGVSFEAIAKEYKYLIWKWAALPSKAAIAIRRKYYDKMIKKSHSRFYQYQELEITDVKKGIITKIKWKYKCFKINLNMIQDKWKYKNF